MSMLLQLSAPSKTFLLGEYLVTQGGPGLLINTEPRFGLTIEHDSQGNHQGIDPHSPAGKYIQHHAEIFNDYALHFTDPHQQQGGFGASTAQFLLCYTAQRGLQYSHWEPQIDSAKMMSSYLQCAWDGQGIAPSGVDLLAQYMGELTYAQGQQGIAERLVWPFENLDFYLCKTPNKIATHEHLKTLDTIHCENFTIAINQAMTALQNHDDDLFITSINDYYNELLRQQLVLPATQQWIKQFRQHEAILAAKGCGALGADVLVVLFEVAQQKVVTQLISQQGLWVIANKSAICSGLTMIQGNSS